MFRIPKPESLFSCIFTVRFQFLIIQLFQLQLKFRFKIFLVFPILFKVIFQSAICFADSNPISVSFSAAFLKSCFISNFSLTITLENLIHNHTHLSNSYSFYRCLCTIHIKMSYLIASFRFERRPIFQIELLLSGLTFTFQIKSHNQFWFSCSVSRFKFLFQIQNTLTFDVHIHFHILLHNQYDSTDSKSFFSGFNLSFIRHLYI